MDSSFLKKFLHSSEDALKEVEDTDEYEDLNSSKIFVPVSETVFKALSTSLTYLLSYKVSKEAYQHYSVRLNVIDILRSWCAVPQSYEALHVLRNGDNMMKFVKNILKNCLTDEVINNCVDSDGLVPLTSSLMCLLPENPAFINDIDRLVKKITQLELTQQSVRLLYHIITRNDDIPISPSTTELIYVTQGQQLIEEPLLNNFARTLSPAEGDVENDNGVNELIECCAEFPPVFRLVCSLLTQLFVKLRYARSVSNYTKAILEQIEIVCEQRDKNAIDLYPTNLQPCVILLRIDPSHHSAQSRECTLRVLREIATESAHDALILLSLFPAWLMEYTTYVRDSV